MKTKPMMLRALLLATYRRETQVELIDILQDTEIREVVRKLVKVLVDKNRHLIVEDFIKIFFLGENYGHYSLSAELITWPVHVWGKLVDEMVMVEEAQVRRPNVTNTAW